MVNNRLVERVSVHLPKDEVILDAQPDEHVVFKDQFSARLRFPCQDLVEEISKAYNIEMHHLTPNGIAKIALFVWAIKSEDVNLDIKAFCALHQMHTQFSKKMVEGKKVIKYFGCSSFKPVRGAK
jgi:hypothetical protein